MRRSLWFTTVALTGLAIAAWRDHPPSATATERVALGSAAVTSTSRQALESTTVLLRVRVEKDPGDAESAALLADALMRAARVESDAGLALEAERVLRGALSHQPADYGARRMLGAVLLAQHRFADALAAADAARRSRPDDAWNYAVAGDALLELGRYDEAFAAFDELNRRRPDPAAYARAAYAREIQGDLAGALRLMQMAADGTGAHDPEGIAWYRAQLGHLRLLEGDVDAAEREFAHAEFAFPDHPYALAGRVRVLLARGRYREAHTRLARGPDTPETWALRGDIAQRLDDTSAAQSAWREAERLEREGWKAEEPQPSALARFLAERSLNTSAAVALAEQGAAVRRDIHTLDALAWAYYRAGQIERASAAIAAAIATGTVEPRIRCHAKAIATVKGGGVPVDACDPLTLYTAAAAPGPSAAPILLPAAAVGGVR